MKPLMNDPTAPLLPGAPGIPPLEPGDRLTRDEFERRYEAMPHLKKAELIEGVVYMSSPVRAYRHGTPRSHLVTWLGVYRAATPGVESGDNTTARLDMDNEPQPDVMLFIEPARGGQVRVSEDDADAHLRGDLARALAKLQTGLASPEHLAFVNRVVGKS